jgi:hypothetical protein
MEVILLAICLVILVLILVIVIGIAGSLVKLIGYIEEEGVVPPRRETTSLELPDREPFYDGVAPRPPNSDGAGGVIEN